MEVNITICTARLVTPLIDLVIVNDETVAGDVNVLINVTIATPRNPNKYAPAPRAIILKY